MINELIEIIKFLSISLELREVYYISKRINSSLTVNKQSYEKLYKLIDEVNSLWSLLDKIIQKVLVFDDFKSYLQVNILQFSFLHTLKLIILISFYHYFYDSSFYIEISPKKTYKFSKKKT